MKIGQLVQIKKDGVTTAPLYKIIGTNGRRRTNLCTLLGSTYCIQEKTSNLHVVNMITLSISISVLKELIEGKRDVVAHPATKIWMLAFTKNIEVVRFISVYPFEEAIFRVKDKVKTKSLHEEIIKIIVKNRIN